jgi:nitrogen fixation NifU-like protein
MSDLSELYQEMILDHNKNPKNYRVMDDATHDAHGANPLCGDKVHLFVKLRNDVIDDISFEGSGCAISKASASLLTEHLKGRSIEESRTIFDNMHKLLTGKEDEMTLEIDDLGKLQAMSGVSEFPMRVKCASLVWHTFHSAIEGTETETTTE